MAERVPPVSRSTPSGVTHRYVRDRQTPGRAERIVYLVYIIYYIFGRCNKLLFILNCTKLLSKFLKRKKANVTPLCKLDCLGSKICFCFQRGRNRPQIFGSVREREKKNFSAIFGDIRFNIPV